MRDSIKWRTVFVLAIIAVCVFFFFFNTKTKQFSPDGTLKLGLDLKGGVHLLLLMDTDISVKNRIDSDIESIQSYLKRKNISIQQIYRPKDQLDSVIVQGKDPNLGPDLQDYTSKNMDYLGFSSLGPGRYQLKMKSNYESDLRDKAITQSVAIIRNRIDRYGVAETAIHREGLHTNKIVVEIPGVEDSTEVKQLIGHAAQLGWYETLPPQSGAPSKDAILKQYNGTLPHDVQIVPGSPDEPNVSGRFYALKTLPVVTGGDIQDSRVETDQYGRPVVGFQLSAVAGQKFREFTSSHVGKHAAIVLDGVVISNPVIKSEIGDRGEIEGNFTPDEAREFVLQLKSGALPAIPHFGEERTVGPSLGLESIHKGAYSGLIGIIAVFIFVLLYYRGSGINAIITLLLNLVILMGIMSTFGMTLTVPGIAGIILTIGMAVDANVLIFERIKEELLDKRSVRTAIVNGFGKAFWTIFDSNVTTLVAALFLLQFGSGPVKGFAITLTVGLLASMFTAIFVSHLIYDMVIAYRSRNGRQPETLSIGPLAVLKGRIIPFMNYKWFFLAVSLALIGVGMWSLFSKPVSQGLNLNWGLDFKGGQSLQIRFNNEVNPRQVEKELKKVVPASLTVIRYGAPQDNEVLIRLEAKDKQGHLLNEQQLSGTLSSILNTLHTPADKSELASGKLDLNAASAKSLEDMIYKGITSGQLAGTEAATKKLVDAVEAYKKDHGGIIPSFQVLTKLPDMSPNMMDFLKKKTFVGSLSVLELNTVGPTVGKELRDKAIDAIIFALIGILIYAWFRFQFRFSLGAVLALFHDTVIAIGFLSLFHVEINLPTVAALLTLAGYSINDTIVVFDRIRERMQATKKAEDQGLFDQAITETLSRTLITSLLTFFVVLAMLLFGGDVIFSFAFVMTVGIIVGTYSSIFIASPIVLWWNQLGLQYVFSRKKKRPRKK